MSEELLSEIGEAAVVRTFGDGIGVTIDGCETTFTVEIVGAGEGRIESEQGSRRFFAHRRAEFVEIWMDGEIYRIGRAAPSRGARGRGAPNSGEVMASMPGMIVRLLVAEGDRVAEGDGIVVIESMKMQLTLSAPRAGKVTDLNAAQGTVVEQGAVLARIVCEPQV
jgi:biotin carboxyl carrier protein